MTSRWSLVNLGEVLRLDIDSVPIDPSAIYPMVGVLSFGRGLFYKKPVQHGNTSYRVLYRLKANHIVMSQLFGWEGALALSSDEFAGRFVSPQFPTFVCDDKRIDRSFLGWWLRLPSFWDDLGERTSGMGDRRRTLNPQALFAGKIPLPPLSEQRRIALKVDSVAGCIEKLRTVRSEIAEDAEALLRSILAHDTTSSPTQMRNLLRLRPCDIDVRSNEVYDFAGVYSFGRGMFKSGRKSGMSTAYKRLTKLRAGDFVYPKLMAWEGALAVVPPECDGCVVSPEFPVFEILEGQVYPEVLDVYFRTPSVWPRISGASTGTNVRRRRLNPTDFLNSEIPLPSRETQFQLRKVYSEVRRLKHLQSDSAPEIEALLPSLLSKAFSGGL